MPSNITLEDVNVLDMVTDTVNPDTGLSNKGGATAKGSPITVNDLDKIDIDAQQGGGAYLGKGDFGLDPSDYDFQLRYGANNDEIRASSQSNAGMIAKGVGRLGLTTLTKLLAGAGYVGASIPALFNGDMNVMLDNGWSGAFNALEEGIKESMPIYKTEKYLNGNILDQMGTLGFWTDDVVDGAAFMLSSLVGAKGLNALGKVGSTYGKIGRAWSQATRAAKTGKGVAGLGKVGANIKKVVDKMDLTTMTAFNTIGEAAFEAKDVKDHLMESYKVDIELGRMTQEEANDRASRAARTTFWTNAAILMPSNYLSTSMFFKNADKLNLDKVFKSGAAAGKTGTQIAKEIPSTLTKGQMAGIFGKDALLSMISEGVYEENMQTALQNYVTDRANNKTDKDLLNGLLTNWAENFSTDEGQKSIALGAIIGLIPGGIGGVRGAKAEASQRANTAIARGAMVDAMKSNTVQDFYERQKIRDDEGNIVGESNAIVVDPETNKPKIDEAKLAGTFQKAYEQYDDFAKAMQALAAGNKNMFNFIRQKQFSNAAFELLSYEGGAETLDGLIDVYAEQEIEDLQRAGFEGQELQERETEVRELAQEYRSTAEQLSKIYRSIQNNHGGLANFGKDALALGFKNDLIKKQYDNAVEQLYLNDLIQKTEQKILQEKVTEDTPVSGIKGLTSTKAELEAESENSKKVLKGAKDALRDSEKRMRDLLNFKKQKEFYKELRDLFIKQNESVGGENKDGTEPENTKAPKVSEGVKISPELTTKTLTKEQAEANGFTEDVERSAVFNEISKNSNPNYYYKTDEFGTTHIVRTDGTSEGNIISNNKLYTRELTKENGDKVTMTHYFVNDDLVKSGVRDHETGEWTPIDIQKLKKSIGKDITEADVNMLFYNAGNQIQGIKAVADVRVDQGYEGEALNPINRIFDLGESTVDQKSIDAHRADVRNEIANTIGDITNVIAEREQRAREEAEIKNPSTDILIRTHGDSRYNNTTPAQHFENGAVKYIPAVYQNKPGYLEREGDQIIFTPTVQGETQYIVSGYTSTETFEELGITALKQVKTDMNYETDGRPFPIKIQGKYYKNPYHYNPSEAISVDVDGNPVKVTLINTRGQQIEFTTPHIVHDVAYTIEMKEALKDRIYDMNLFGSDSSAFMIADPKTGISYGVQRVNGTYIVHKANPGNKPSVRIKGNSKIYDRVVKETEKQMDKAIAEVSKMNLPANSAEKIIANEFRRYLQNVRAASSGEALSLPDQREVQNAEKVTRKETAPEKSEVKQKDTTSEKEVEDEQAKQDAIEAEALARKEAQEKLARQEQSSMEEGKGTNIETVGKDEVEAAPEEKFDGVHNPATAVSYVWFNRDTNEFVVNNGNFMKHAVNNTMENAQGYPVIDFSGSQKDFWENNPRLKAKLESGTITDEEIEALLAPKFPEEFNTYSDKVRGRKSGLTTNTNYVDILPIKFIVEDKGTTFDSGVFLHESGYKHIAVPEEVKAQGIEAEAKYIEDVKRNTRATRYAILKHILKGTKIAVPFDHMTKGHPNLGENKPLRSLIKELDPTRDLRSTTLGAAISDGTIYINGKEETGPGFGSRGNIFWITTDTANGQAYNLKLNPKKITEEHARIAYKALIYSQRDGLTAKYPDSDVTGGLTNQQVLHFLTVQGKKKTAIGKGNKALQHLRPKQLWTTKGGNIIFGDNEMSMRLPETEKEFIKWMTANKNYPMDISKLNTKLPQSFSIGTTMNYNVETDNYNSFLLNSDTLYTNAEVVPGTKSIMNNPVINFNTSELHIKETVPQSKQEVKPETVVTKAKNPVKPVTQQAVEKNNSVTLDNGKEITYGKMGGTLKNIQKLRDGSTVYFFNPKNPEAGKIRLGAIGTVEGKRYFAMTNTPFTGSLEFLNRYRSQSPAFELTDDAWIKKLDRAIAGFEIFLHFDSPTTAPKKAAEIKDEVQDKISDEVYNDFVDNGTVDISILEGIATDIMSGTTLSKRQQAIHAEFTSRIEDIIKDKAKEKEPTKKFGDSKEVTLSEARDLVEDVDRGFLAEVLDPYWSQADYPSNTKGGRIASGETLTTAQLQEAYGIVDKAFGIEPKVDTETVQEEVQEQEGTDTKPQDRNVEVEPMGGGVYNLRNEANEFTIEFESFEIMGQPAVNMIINAGTTTFEDQDELSDVNEMLKAFLGQEEDVLPKDDFGFALEGINPVIIDSFSSYADSQEGLNEEDQDEGINGLDDIDDAPFMAAAYKPKKTIKVSSATKWLKSRFKGLDVEIHQGLIELGENRHAFGQSRLDSILLSTAAAYGAEYHEAFHRVSLFLMKDVDRLALYEKARKEYSMPDATNKEIEEALAEQFRYYVIQKEENKPTTVIGKIAEFFQKMWNYIMTVFAGPGKLTNIEIEELFQRIEAGRFRYTNYDVTRTAELQGRFANFEVKGTKFQHIQNDTEYREVVQNMFYTLVESSGLLTRKTVKGMRVLSVNYNSPADLQSISFSSFKRAVKENMNKYKKAAEKEKNPEKKAVAQRIYDIHKEVTDNWSVVFEDLKDYMASLNINVIREDSDIDLKEYDQETGDNKNDFDQYNKVSFESSSKDNTANTIKLLMSILPASNERSQLTGMYKFTEFGPTWSKLLIDNLNIVEPTDMMNVLRNKAKSHLPYQVLLKLLESNPNLKAQFFTTVKQSRLDFINAYFNKSEQTFDAFFGDAAVRSATKSNIKDWGTAFNRNPELFIQKKGDKVQPNLEGFEKLQDEYNMLYRAVKREMDNKGTIANFQQRKAKLKELLDRIGITLTDDQFDFMLNQTDPQQEAALLKFMMNRTRYVFGTEGTLYKLFSKQNTNKKITFANAFTNESSISWIAEQAAASDPLALGDSILGPAGKLYYLITQHTYLTNEIDRLKKDPKEIARRKLKAVYNQNSVYLNALMNDPKLMKDFSLKTLSSVVRENAKDTGREYKKVTDLEEYIIRMAASHRGYATPPTPGDRSSYQYFKGMPTLKLAFDSQYNFNEVEGTLPIIGTFKGYLQDEINRIKLTKEQVDAAIEGGRDSNWRNLVENLHFKVPKGVKVGYVVQEGEVFLDSGVVKRKGDTIRSTSIKLLKNKKGYTGNGTKLTHFAGAEKMEGSLDEIVTKILQQRLKDELKSALDMGIIGKSESGAYTNILIPSSIMEAAADRTGIDNSSLHVVNAIADFMLNTMMTNIEMGKVFTADPASFAHSDDYIKRLTGYTSTGTNLYTEFPSGYYKNDELITAPTYNVTTFSSHVIESQYYDELMEMHTEWNLKAGIAKTRDEAEAIAADKLSALLFVDQTDAQTFITPEMYRALSVKLGEWGDQKEAAYQLLTDSEFDFDNMDGADVLNAYNVVMQPLKTTYMKTYQEGNQSYSVFDKMSMSTLFRPMIKGTQLEDLLNRMEAKGKYEGETPVHQVKFHTSEKAGRKDRRDFFTNKNEDTLNLQDLSVYAQDFDHIRKQLVTDPHDVRTIMFGSQAKKIGISNVQLEPLLDKDGNVIIDNEYQNVFDKDETLTGKELVKEVHAMMSELSNRGAEKFKKDLRLGDDYSIIDKVALAERMKEEARKANLPQYVVEAFKIDPRTKDFYVDFDSIPGARKWIQTRIISLIKKATIDLDLPGNSYIQMTNIGLRKLDKSEDLRFIAEEGLIEAAVSVSLFKHAIPNYKKKTHAQRVQFLKDNPQLTAMGYRVPTQGQNSTYMLKIVRFLEEQVGDTVILPAEGTAIGGFDFDIDKMYMVRHNYKNGNKVKYLTKKNSTKKERMKLKAEEELAEKIREIKSRYITQRKDLQAKLRDLESLSDEEFEAEFKRVTQASKDAATTEIGGLINDWMEANEETFESLPMEQQNTEAAVQNRLLDMYFSVWQNEKHAAHRTQPLGYAAGQLKDLASSITKMMGLEEATGQPLSTLTPTFQLNVKSKFKFGAEGLGPNALANVHQILGQYVGLGLYNYLGIGNSTVVGQEDAPALEWSEFLDLFLQGEHNLFNLRVSLSNKERVAARKNILENKKTKQSEILMATLQTFYENGQIEFVTGTGANTVYHSKRIEEYFDIPTKPVKKGKRVTDFSSLLGQDNEYITEWFSALIDSHVDIAADPYISKLNANPFTNDVITLMIRAGVGGINTFKFMSQPALREAARMADNKDNKLDVEVGNPLKVVTQKMLKEYSRLTGEEKPVIPKGRSAVRALFSDTSQFDKSFEDFGNNNFTKEYYYRQLLALEVFKYFKTPANYLKEAILSSRVDTKKIGNTLIGILSYEARTKKAYQDDIDQKGIRNYIKMYDNTYLGTLTDNSITLSKNAVSSVLMEGLPAFRVLHSNIMDQIGGRFETDEKLIGKVADEIYVNVAASFFKEKLLAGKDSEGNSRDTKEVSKLLYGDQSIPKRLYDIRRKDANHPLKNNTLVKMLSPIFEQDRPDFLYMAKPDDKWHKDSIVRAWKDLLTGEGIERLLPDNVTEEHIEAAKKESKQLGKDLFMYSYLTSGFKTGVYSFFDLIPRELLVDVGYDNYIKSIKKTMNDPSALAEMMDEIFLNNWHDSDFVPVVAGMQVKKSIKDNTMIMLNATFIEDLYIGENTHGDALYRPYVKTGQGDTVRLYRYGGIFEQTGDPVYYEVDKKSYYNRGYVLRENMFSETRFKSNRIQTTVPEIRENLKDPYAFMQSVGVDIIEDIMPAKYSEKKDEMPSEATENIYDINPIKREGVKEELETEINNTVGNLVATTNIPTNFYTLTNGSIVFIENLGKDDIGYLYDIEHWGSKSPSREAIKKRKEECK